MSNRGEQLMSAVMVEFERDNRTMNHMDPETKLVHARLEEWGSWAKDAEIRAWPSITPMGRMVEEGPHGAGQQTKPPISMPDTVAQIDSAVAKLGAIDKMVIKRYYQCWQPIEVMARLSGMRVRQFQNVLRRSRWRIIGYLDAQK
jgi:hypothetical protein